MKNIILFFALISQAFSEVSTYNGSKAHWGWSGEMPDFNKVCDPVVIGILEEYHGKISPFALQAKVDAVTTAEFLWKVTVDEVAKADKTASSYIVGGAQVTRLEITLDAQGKGVILLYSQAQLVGRVRCQCANKREGENSQITPGNFKIGLKDKDYVNGKKVKMPFAMNVDPQRGIFIHQGDIAKTASAGCLRVSKPVARVLFSLIKKGTPVKVIWK
jgi:hypothetical protein